MRLLNSLLNTTLKLTNKAYHPILGVTPTRAQTSPYMDDGMVTREAYGGCAALLF